MKHVFISRKGDTKLFLSFYNSLKTLKEEELIDQYNQLAKLGILGVHAQALKLLAMRRVFIERFNNSPIIIEDEIVISLSGQIDSEFPAAL